MLDWLEAQIVRLIELTERVTIALENIARVLLAYDAAHGGLALPHADLVAHSVPDGPRLSRDPAPNSPASDLQAILFAKRPDA